MAEDSRELNAPTNDDDETTGGRKKRLLKKAPDAPKRFKTAYICFVMEKMDIVKESSSKEEKVRFWILSYVLNNRIFGRQLLIPRSRNTEIH